jgi:hypothetical protein
MIYELNEKDALESHKMMIGCPLLFFFYQLSFTGYRRFDLAAVECVGLHKVNIIKLHYSTYIPLKKEL